MVVHSRLSF